MYGSTCGIAGSGQWGQAQPDWTTMPPRDISPATNDLDYSGFNIFRATQHGVLYRVKQLVDAGCEVNQRDHEGVTPLHWAAANNRCEIIEYLLAKGARMDAVAGNLQSTPLHWAARQGHVAATALLLQAGSDPSVRDADGCACVHRAAQLGFTAVVECLLVRGGVSPNELDARGMTPLMWASCKECIAAPVELLLRWGASTRPADRKYGNTALHWAAIAMNAPAVSALILYGDASLDVPNLRGMTPLMMLDSSGYEYWAGPEVCAKIEKHIQDSAGKGGGPRPCARRSRRPVPAAARLSELLCCQLSADPRAAPARRASRVVAPALPRPALRT